MPNVPILLWMATVVARELLESREIIEPGSTAMLALEWAGTLTLGWWAVDELVRGVNPWRRVLGLGGCVVVVLGVVQRLG